MKLQIDAISQKVDENKSLLQKLENEGIYVNVKVDEELAKVLARSCHGSQGDSDSTCSQGNIT